MRSEPKSNTGVVLGTVIHVRGMRVADDVFQYLLTYYAV